MINLNPTILDITQYPQKNKLRLQESILEAVKDTQTGFMLTLPDELHMRVDQYELLQDDPQMLSSHKDRLYYTKYNCMEVRVLK